MLINTFDTFLNFINGKLGAPLLGFKHVCIIQNIQPTKCLRLPLVAGNSRYPNETYTKDKVVSHINIALL